MTFNLSIGGTTFILEISSDSIDESLISAKFLPLNPIQKKHNSDRDDDRDAVITLKDFNGKLYIRHASNATTMDQGAQYPQNFDTKSTLAKAKEKIEDFDVDLDHIVISKGVEWYGRVPNCEYGAQCEIDHEESDDGNNSLLFGQVSQEKEVMIKQQTRPSVMFGQSGETINASNITPAFGSITNKAGRRWSSTPPDVSNIHAKNKELSNMLKQTFLSSLKGAHQPTDVAMISNNIVEEIDEDDNGSTSSYSTFSDNLSFQTLTQSKQQRSIRCETNLHKACKKPKTKVKELSRILRQSPSDTSIKNANGELPLHVIALNEHVLFGRDSDEVKVFIDDLIKEYPYSLLTENDRGQIPFTTAIFNWIDDVHNFCYDSNEIFYFDTKYNEEKVKLIPKVVYADPMVEWSFKMLSEVYNRIETANKAAFATATQNISPEEEFIKSFANSTCHCLFKTLLLINDDVLRVRIFDYNFMKRCYLFERTVSEWLVVFLSNKKTRKRAIEYFEGLSELTASSALGISKPRVTDVIKFCERLEDVIVKISKMEHILPALFMLNGQDMKRACLTYPVQRILEISMTDPSLLGILIFDLCIHFLLVMAFNVQKVYSVHSNSTPTDVTGVLQQISNAPLLMTTMISVYLFFREEVVSFLVSGLGLQSYRKGLQRYKSIWHIIEILTIIFVLVTNVMFFIKGADTPYVLFGITKALIWLRLFSFLKGINLHLTMFVASAGKIVYHMRWFIVVLVLTMFMFADMMHVIKSSTAGQCVDIDYENDSSVNADYCSDSLLRNTIRPFGVITGDFNIDDYRFSVAATTLFVVYLTVGLIILLNVLIAIVTESYFKSNRKRYSLLGRARIPILAKHNYLDTKANHIAQRGRTDCVFITIMSLIALFLLLFLISFITLVRTLLSDESLTTHSQVSQFFWTYGQIVLISILFIIANISIIVTIKDWFHLKCKCMDESKFAQLIKRPVVPIVYALLGIDNRKKYFTKKEEGLDGDDILPAVKEMVDKCTLRIRNDVQKLKRTLKKSIKKQRNISSRREMN